VANKYKVFNIIRQAGEPQKGKLPDGTVVHRLTEIAEEETMPDGTVGFSINKCAPYDNHFIYRVPDKVKGPRYCCSCGSMAVLTGSKSYKALGSAQGRMWVCHVHTLTSIQTGHGVHADGSA
jgi:hypothetical protein